jgi:phage-related protein
MKSPPFFTGKCISVHAITKQAEDFLGELTEREQRDFDVAVTILDHSRERGRPPGGRSERVADSKQGLFELRITPPGRRGPHTRALYAAVGKEILVARVLRKAQRGIPHREIELADRDVAAMRRALDEESGEGGRAA